MKTIQEQIAVMQAFADGKEIEAKNIGDSNSEWYSCAPFWNWVDCDYRIKPEQPKRKIVPYESAEEFLAAMKEHGPFLMNKHGLKSYRFPNQIFCNEIKFIKAVILIKDGLEVENTYTIPYNKILDEFTWQDGTPCGKEIWE